MNYSSMMCQCGHPISFHYRKNYRMWRSHRGHMYGNVDFRGCDGCNWMNVQCKHFKPLKVLESAYGFENDFRWHIHHPALLKLYKESIEGKEQAYNWIVQNDVEYLRLLKEHNLIVEEEKEDE